MSSVAIRVAGLKQLSRSLKTVDTNLPKVLRVALNSVAQVVIDEARPDIPQRTGRAARSLRASSTRTAVRVSAGGAKAPYYPWLDFGGRVGRKKATERPFYSDGRYLYPAYYRRQPEIPGLMSDAFRSVAEQGGLEVD